MGEMEQAISNSRNLKRCLISIVVALSIFAFLAKASPYIATLPNIPNVFAQTHVALNQMPSSKSGYWTEDNGTRLTDASIPYVIALQNGEYRMYYCANGGILSAISSDGLNWTKESGVRLSPGAGGSQESIVCDPTVIRLSNGEYRMYYDGINTGGQYQDTQVKIQIYSALSPDGLNFQREGVRINSSTSLANGLAAVPEITRTSDGKYRLYYVSNRVFQPTYEDYMVSAISSDGLNFTYEGLVGGISPQNRDPAVATMQNGTILMLFSCGSDGGCLPPGIFAAQSQDGRNFVEEPHAIVYATTHGIVPVDPSVVSFPDGTFRVYYWYDCSCSSTPSVVSAHFKPQYSSAHSAGNASSNVSASPNQTQSIQQNAVNESKSSAGQSMNSSALPTTSPATTLPSTPPSSGSQSAPSGSNPISSIISGIIGFFKGLLGLH